MKNASKSVIAHYEQQTEDETVAEDEAAFRDESSVLIEVPVELVPAVRELIAKHAAQNHPQAEQGT